MPSSEECCQQKVKQVKERATNRRGLGGTSISCRMALEGFWWENASHGSKRPGGSMSKAERTANAETIHSWGRRRTWHFLGRVKGQCGRRTGNRRVGVLRLEREARSGGTLKSFILTVWGNHWMGFEQERNLLGITFLEDCFDWYVTIDPKRARPEAR